jgi:acetyl esterase/lipase
MTSANFLHTLLAALCGAGDARAENLPATYEVEVHKDLAYYDGPDAHPVKHKLDLFVPKGKKGYPVLFFVHGGAWRSGDKSFLGVYTALGKFFASRGVGTVVINYRLSPAVQHPEHVKDVARAFAWTQRRIADYGGDPRQVFVCGHSAGGHLVSLLATDETYLKAEGLSVKDVKGVVSISGVYDIPDKFLPRVFGPDGEGRRQASPLHHVRAGLPPFLILCADNDYPGCGKVPSEAFARALRDKGTPATFQEIADATHLTIIARAAQPDDAVTKAILDFIAANTAKR